MTGRVLAFISAAVVAVALAAPAGANQLPASLGAFACHTASNRLNRYVEVTATMQPVSATTNMKMRFELQQRLPGHPFHQLHGGDLGTWKFPRPPLGKWSVIKQVVSLPAPAVYRFRVSFVWLGHAGTRIGFQTVLSPTCRQPK